LVKGGKVRRGQLGVSIQPMTSDIAANLGLKDVNGVLVSAVTPGSAADRAGVKAGDVIVAMNGQPTNNSNELRNRVAATAPGTGSCRGMGKRCRTPMSGGRRSRNRARSRRWCWSIEGGRRSM